MLSRIGAQDLLDRNWSRQEFLLQSGWQTGWSPSVPRLLQRLWWPATPELQPIWCAALGAFVALDIPFRSTVVQLRAAARLEGPWSAPSKVADIMILTGALT